MINIKLPKKSELMTEKDWFEFRNVLDSDLLGFDTEIEGSLNDNFTNNVSTKISGTIFGDINIQNNLTTRNYTNGSGTNRIKYIVIHYTANNGDTAYGNTQYFKSEYRGASAHYFVDENYIYRCVEDENISWHCGGGLQGNSGHTYYKICTNSNSIGIEMCSRKYSNGTYYFKEETIKNCINLVKYLMNKYNLSSDKVIRHYDVTGKICPAPFVNDVSQWNNFKKRLNINDNKIDEHWCQSTLDTLYNKGYIKDKNQWSKFNDSVSKALVLSLLDNMTGGIWKSNEANKNIHWCHPNVISLCGKRIITDKQSWICTLDDKISKALLLALICNMTGGVSDLYKNRVPDHWARNCLDTLCDRGIIKTPSAWTDFEKPVTKSNTMALLYKTICK